MSRDIDAWKASRIRKELKERIEELYPNSSERITFIAETVFPYGWEGYMQLLRGDSCPHIVSFYNLCKIAQIKITKNHIFEIMDMSKEMSHIDWKTNTDFLIECLEFCHVKHIKNLYHLAQELKISAIAKNSPDYVRKAFEQYKLTLEPLPLQVKEPPKMKELVSDLSIESRLSYLEQNQKFLIQGLSELLARLITNPSMEASADEMPTERTQN